MKGISPSEKRSLLLSVGTHKAERPITPVEVGSLMQKALDAGEKRRNIADELYFNDTTMIGRFTRLLSLPRDILPLIDWGSDESSISFTAATEIARLDSAEDQRRVAKSALKQHLSGSEIKEVVQIFRRSDKNIEQAIQAVLDRRPEVEERHVIIGELRSIDLSSQLAALNQSERNELLRSALEHVFPDTPIEGAKLGSKHFILVGEAELRNAAVSITEGFEETITTALKNEV